MIVCYADRAKLSITRKELLTTGTVGLAIHFDFSADWNGLAKTAVFRNGEVQRDALLTDGDAIVPWEVLGSGECKFLTVGVYGTDGGTIVIPTIYAEAGIIHEGADPSGDPSIPPTPSVVDQILEAGEKSSELTEAMHGGTAGQVWTQTESGEPEWADPQGVKGDTGDQGEPGYSPTVSITSIPGGHRITITDEQVAHVADVMDGGSSLPTYPTYDADKSYVLAIEPGSGEWSLVWKEIVPEDPGTSPLVGTGKVGSMIYY